MSPNAIRRGLRRFSKEFCGGKKRPRSSLPNSHDPNYFVNLPGPSCQNSLEVSHALDRRVRVFNDCLGHVTKILQPFAR